MYRLVMISIERSETAQKSALEIRDKFSLRQNAVHDKIQSENFFPMVGKIFFWTEFCLEVYLSWTEFCLGLHTAVVFRMQSFNLFFFQHDAVSKITYEKSRAYYLLRIPLPGYL